MRAFTRLLLPTTTTLTRTTRVVSLFRPSSRFYSMATPYKVHISPQNTGLWAVPQTEEAAKKASLLLQEDLEKHHTFFNEEGFHNHIPHHILALFGTGADASSLQKGYDGNAHYQRPALPPHPEVIQELRDWDHAREYLGNEKYYPDFLRFFQKEMETQSWEDVVLKYLFKAERDDATDDMLVRLYSGFLHPLIQLMCGMEWSQPAIVAEALAQVAVHGNDIKPLLLESEKLANEQDGNYAMPDLVELYDAVKRDEKLANAPKMSDPNKLRAVLARAKDEMVAVAGRVKVRPEELEKRTAEMFNAAVYVASSAALAQYPQKHPKFDFFLMHHVNSSPIFVTINRADWIPEETKVRLLEWKIRMDLAQYAARAVPELSIDKISNYQPKKLEKLEDKMKDLKVKDAKPTDVISRLHEFEDDGHAIKLGRAAGVAYHISKKYEDDESVKLMIKGEETWTRVFHLIVDSVEAPGPNWVRSCGFAEAWKEVPDMKQDVDGKL
ncbi:HypA protein [Diplogelasinospora grovesii]|uniref:HypA protein n=1 Tax=Diplogelasinospora grovesii TaxID=303347 RepID=A0AAN6N6Y9_9PEZI|nr:HypA protein [Diplogelasinospora grovesii]